MPTFPQTAALVLGGFALGFAAASGLCLTWRQHDQRLRRASLGFAAGALLAALTRLLEDPPVVDPDLIRQVAGIRDLAAAVARLVEE